ncbi:MAG: GNAT family N-acetyltransferase [Bacteroidales bacterium]
MLHLTDRFALLQAEGRLSLKYQLVNLSAGSPGCAEKADLACGLNGRFSESKKKLARAKQKLVLLRNKLAKRIKKKYARAKKKKTRLRKKYLFRVYYEYIMDLDTWSFSPTPRYSIIRADKRSLQQMKLQQPAELTDRKYHILVNRLENTSEICFLILDDQEEICGYSHIAFADHLNTRINYMVKLDQYEAYIFDVYVFRDKRKKGFHAFAVSQRLQMAKEKGYKRVLSIVEIDNIPSHKAVTRFGFSPIKTLWYIPLINRTIALKK